MYADTVTRSMEIAINETNRRRSIQIEYNKEHNITPKTIIKNVSDVLAISSSETLKSPKKQKKMSKSKKDKLNESRIFTSFTNESYFNVYVGSLSKT